MIFVPLRSLLVLATLLLAAQTFPARGGVAEPRPMKLSIRALELGHVAGSKVPVEVALLDSANQAIAALSDTTVDITIVSPSQKTATSTVVIQKGKSAVRTEVQASEAGVNRLSARHRQHELFDGNSSFLVRSPDRARLVLKPVQPIVTAAADSIAKRRLDMPAAALSATSRGFSPVPAPAPPPPPVVTPAALPAGSSKLQIDVPDRGTGYLADGRDFAPVSVYYLSADGSRAPADIEVVLSAVGAAVTPSRVIIKRDTDSGEARVTSNARTQSVATVAFVESFPPHEVAGPQKFTVRFGPPIHALLVDPKLTISLVDNFTMAARFVDGDGNPIQSGIKRSVWFQTQTSTVKLKSQKVDVGESDPAALDVIIPASVGDADIEVFMDGYQRQYVRVHVDGLMVILMLVVGSICGGVCAFLRLKGRLPVRLFTGLIGGAVSVWLYVYLGLPLLDASVAHSTISVFFVAILGGYAGTEVIEMLTKPLLKGPA